MICSHFIYVSVAIDIHFDAAHCHQRVAKLTCYLHASSIGLAIASCLQNLTSSVILELFSNSGRIPSLRSSAVVAT